jgi:hypothetical protein
MVRFAIDPAFACPENRLSGKQEFSLPEWAPRCPLVRDDYF